MCRVINLRWSEAGDGGHRRTARRAVPANVGVSVDQLTRVVLLVAGSVCLVACGAFGFVSLAEGERRAARGAFGLAVASSVALFAASLLPVAARATVAGGLVAAAVAVVGLSLLPIGRVEVGNDAPRRRFDEREIMFARMRLQPGSPEHESYYAMHPDHKASDDVSRSKPGLLSPRSRLANPFQFASAHGSFGLTEALRHAVDGGVAVVRPALPSAAMTAYVKSLARFYGALDIGVTRLEPYHVYSHVGRGTGVYGAPIAIEHAYALAFTVEMDFRMVGASPAPPTTMATGKQYVEAARIAVQLAGAIRALGYSARAHIDGNYQVIAPLVARDAGLGQIGRMGLLMTPRQGPRVRLGVVTTALELVPDARTSAAAVIDFCNVCRKCANVCPSRSIPFGDREEIDGALRWRIDPDTCFLHWNVIGTDCARCMAVCPYSHPNTLSHKLVRWAVDRSGFLRRAALWLDDFFYGRTPAAREAPDWVRVP